MLNYREASQTNCSYIHVCTQPHLFPHFVAYITNKTSFKRSPFISFSCVSTYLQCNRTDQYLYIIQCTLWYLYRKVGALIIINGDIAISTNYPQLDNVNLSILISTQILLCYCKSIKQYQTNLSITKQQRNWVKPAPIKLSPQIQRFKAATKIDSRWCFHE